MTSHTPTIILLKLPADLFIGLDTIALSPSSRFTGFIDIPTGWHFLYAGSNASLSTRTGYWLHVADSARFLRVFEWNPIEETLVPATELDTDDAAWEQRLASGTDLRKGLLPYQIRAASAVPAELSKAGAQSVTAQVPTDNSIEPSLPEEVDFNSITSHIKPAVLNRLTKSGSAIGWTISTTSCAVEDREDIPGLELADRRFQSTGVDSDAGPESELHFLGINLKQTWRDGAIGEERTKGARDRSWALEQIVEQSNSTGESSEEPWGNSVLAELEICFVMVLLLANWSCLEEWKRVLGLVLTCREGVKPHQSFFVEFLCVLRHQLERCGDVDGGLFDVKGEEAGLLKEFLRRFGLILKDLDEDTAQVKTEFEALENWTRDAWGWELGSSYVRRGMVDLEDGERVELDVHDMDAEDEEGEYAPAIVEL